MDKHYQAILHNAPFGYALHKVIANAEGVPIDYLFVDANKAFEELLDIPSEAIIGKRVSEMQPSQNGFQFNWISFYGEMAMQGVSREFEHYSQTTGRWYKVQVYSPEKDYFSTVFMDISKEKRVNSELENFFSVNLDLLCIATTRGKFVKLNKEWESVLGYTIDELEGTNFMSLIHPEDVKPTMDALLQLENQKNILNFTNRYRKKDGTYRHIEWRSHPQGSLIYAAARDITDRVKKEQLIDLRLKLIDYSRSNNLDKLITKALDFICDLINSPIGFYHFIEADQKTISLQQWSTETIAKFCKAPGQGLYYSIDKAGVWVDCVKTKKPVIHNNYKELKHRKGLPEGHADVERELVVPVIRNNKIVAILGVGNKPTNYSEQDAEFVSFIADVTWGIVESKRNEEQLLLLSQAANQSPASIVITDTEGRIEYVNPKFTQLTGYTHEEAKGQNPRILKSGNTPREEYIRLWSSLKNGAEWQGEFHNIKKDGESYWEFATISPVKNDEGETTHYLAIKEDITERKKAEELLRDSEQQFRTMVANVPGVIFRCLNDPSWTMIFISDTIEGLLGYQANDFINSRVRTYTSIIHPEDVELVTSSISESIRNKISYSITYRVFNSTKKVKWVQENGQGVYDNHGYLKFIDGVIIDITEQRNIQQALVKSESQLKELNGTKDKFFSIISHDIKGVFSSILLISELIVEKTKVLGNKDLTSLGNMLNEVSYNGYSLLENLLSWSRSQTGRLKFTPTTINIKTTAEKVYELLKISITDKQIDFRLTINTNHNIIGDKFMIETVFRNLISNAVKFTPAGGSIEVRSVQHKNYSQVSIVDTGVGISNTDIKKLFRIDTNYSTAGTNKELGSGLGLIICQEFITKNGGQIWAESIEGKGSSFHFTIPKNIQSE